MAWWKRRKAAPEKDAPPQQEPLLELAQEPELTLEYAPGQDAMKTPVQNPKSVSGLRARFQAFKARLAQWRKPLGAQRSVTEAELATGHGGNTLFVHGEDALAFGLNWHLLQKGQKQKLQSEALAQGYTHHVVGIESDQIGFLKLSQGQRDKRPIYSVALLLSETVSLGGDEVFVFRLDESRHALVALKNSMPVPGFDRIGTVTEISKAASDYLSLPHKNEVRRCGDAEILSGAEAFDFNVPLEALDRNQPRLKPIPDVRKLLFQGAVLAGLILVLVLGWAGWSYFQAHAEAERLQRESDPNVLYEQNFLNSAASIKGLGTPGLDAMLKTLTSIPMDVAGWGLSHVACQPNECTATWVRNYGNYADFDENLPPDVKQKPEYGFIAGDVKSTQLKTRHPVTLETPKDAKGLKREALPVVAAVQSDFVSRLQDYTLIDARVQVSPPTPFPSGVADIGPVFKPVVSGTWSMELPLWTMGSVTLPDYVQVDSLTLELGATGSSRTELAKGAKHYKLTGKYYAKGKVF